MTGVAGVVTLTDPYKSRHGGTLRTRGFIRGIESAGFVAKTFIPTAPNGVAAQRGKGHGLTHQIKSSLGVAKRHFVPMPTVWGGRDKELSANLSAQDAKFLLISVLSQAQYSKTNSAPYWFDFMDVWSDFASREAMHREPLAKMTSLLQAKILRRYETNVALGARIVTAAGWKDTATLRSLGVDCQWLPTALPDVEFRSVAREGSSARVAGFLGNFEFWPNKDAVNTLVRHWLPALRSEGWTLLVAGHGSDRLNLPDDVHALGVVDDLDDYYSKIDVTLAPIRLGGGMKVKVVESWARGIPVVGSPFAFEGFPPEFSKYFVEVPLQAPVFGQLADLSPIAMTDPALAVFRQSSMSTRIEELLVEAEL